MRLKVSLQGAVIYIDKINNSAAVKVLQAGTQGESQCHKLLIPTLRP